LGLHLGLGLAWIALLASRAPTGPGHGATGPQVFVMLLLAGWLPSLALAAWQVQHRRWRSLLCSDLLGAGLLTLLACTAYVPLFFFNVAWFLPLALLPRGVLSEVLVRLLPVRTKDAMSHRFVAQRFGDCIAKNDYSAACALLGEELQSSMTPETIKNAVAAMIAYAPGSIQDAQVMDEFTLEDWPGKQPGDLAVVYVALNGESFSEAVTLTLAQYGEGVLIRQLEWGRP
jgi:hypothetical protein